MILTLFRIHSEPVGNLGSTLHIPMIRLGPEQILLLAADSLVDNGAVLLQDMGLISLVSREQQHYTIVGHQHQAAKLDVLMFRR